MHGGRSRRDQSGARAPRGRLGTHHRGCQRAAAHRHRGTATAGGLRARSAHRGAHRAMAGTGCRSRAGGRSPRSQRHARARRRGRPMTVDLTQFHDAFFEESFEALDAMEAALLKLDVGSPEPELINTIFRVAHSIKGGSATFGFSEIASFTHSLETLLDELRSGTMPVTVALSDLL